jgi:ADP-heptose:LPS heptosyltransferase
MKLLVIRMSSLGDVILSTAFLESLPAGTQVDWIIASEFAFALQGHPKIRNLLIFDKKTKLKGWLTLLRETLKNDYDARIDLHVTLRSKIARIFFWIQDGRTKRRIAWHAISKERWSFLAAVTLKKLTPPFLKPTPFWQRFSQLAKMVVPNATLSPPNYEPLLQDFHGQEHLILKTYALTPKKYLAVMPASRWKSKEWNSQHFVSVAEALYHQHQLPILILGRASDQACVFLMKVLTQKQIPFFQALEEKDFKVTAVLLKHSIAYLGGDTGLAHLAEAVGTPSLVIYGPTRPVLGFGPWRKESHAIFSDVGCAPCSKDGKFCYRLTDPYACLKRITVAQVIFTVIKILPSAFLLKPEPKA